jgi:hypothetical protein
MRSLLLIAIVVTSAAAAADLRAAGVAAPCRGAQLTGRFTVVAGSAGAGNIVYALVLRNRSASTCTVTGLPVVTLRGRAGKRLPTQVKAAFPGALTAILVTLAPGEATRATARFSPDVPGPGEPSRAPCEPKAYRLVISAPGGGTTTAPISPPTAVCEHGLMSFSAYGR